MKIVIAPDSFKESLSAADAARAIERGVKQACPGAHTVLVPMADGGEGTVEAVLAATGGQARQTRVRDALGRDTLAQWGWLDDATAVIEMASAAGLEGIAAAQRDPLGADTYGVGQLILAALDDGARTLILGLGGSATTDGGSGMLRALGARFLDAQGKEIAPGGAALQTLARIDLDGLDARLASLDVHVACDVDNPLCGPQGAAHVFGPQKGANPQQVAQLDAALGQLATIAHHTLGTTIATPQVPEPPAAWALPRTRFCAPGFGRAWNSSPNGEAWRKRCKAPRWPSPAKAAWMRRPCAARHRPASPAWPNRRECPWWPWPDRWAKATKPCTRRVSPPRSACCPARTPWSMP